MQSKFNGNSSSSAIYVKHLPLFLERMQSIVLPNKATITVRYAYIYSLLILDPGVVEEQWRFMECV
jgi:hypothetical protein